MSGTIIKYTVFLTLASSFYPIIIPLQLFSHINEDIDKHKGPWEIVKFLFYDILPVSLTFSTFLFEILYKLPP